MAENPGPQRALKHMLGNPRRRGGRPPSGYGGNRSGRAHHSTVRNVDLSAP